MSGNNVESKGCRRFISRGCIFFFYLPFLSGIILIAGIWLYSRSSDRHHQAIVEEDLQNLASLIQQYQYDTGRFPTTLDDLLAPKVYLTEIPIDVYSQDGSPYLYSNLGEDALVFVYSIGKDGMDNHGFRDIHRVLFPGKPANDLRYLYAYIQYERTKADPDNALPLFIKAVQKQNTSLKVPYAASSKITSPSIVTNAPSVNESPYVLAGQVQSNTESIRWVLEAARRPYTRLLMQNEDFNFDQTQPWDGLGLGDLFVCVRADAAKKESQGDFKGAIDGYLADIRLWEFYFLYPPITGPVTNDEFTLKDIIKIQELLTKEPFDPEYLEDLVQRISYIKSVPGDYAITCERVIDMVDRFFRQRSLGDSIEWARANISSMGPSVSLSDKILIYRAAILNSHRAEIQAKERFIQDARDYGTPYKDWIASGIMSGTPEDYSSTGQAHKQFVVKKLAEKNCYLTHLTAMQLMAAMKLYHLRYGRYPNNLDELKEILEVVPVDPFSEQPFVYKNSNDSFAFHGFGPDLENQNAEIRYDPTNGIISAGDMVFPQ